MTVDRFGPFPVKPRDWVADSSGRIAQVKDVCFFEGEILLDLWMYSRDGDKLGRTSPVERGPRTYEPMCSWAGWFRIDEPSFPLDLEWVTGEDGKRMAEWGVGPKLPSREWVKKPRRNRFKTPAPRDEILEALKKIAAGHNDPRSLAASVLKGTK